MSSKLIPVLVQLLILTASAQRKPEFGTLPPVGPNRIEVRFAEGITTIVCKQFHLVALREGKLLLEGWFHSGFDIPKTVKNLPHRDSLELRFKCGGKKWQFSNVGERAFLPGRWWVGTDYPPFHTEFRGPRFRSAASIEYLITDPLHEPGFDVYKITPKEAR
jgi:hypothetical protein